MKSIRTQDAVGHALLHDLVRIVIGEVKDTPFRRGHVITEEDIPKLLDLGKEHIFVMEPEDEGFVWPAAKICTKAQWHKVKLKPLQT